MQFKYHILFAEIFGFGSIIAWIYYICSDQLPEIHTDFIRSIFYLFTEFLMCFLLIIGGIGLAKKQSWGRVIYLIGLAMQLYSAIISIGDFVAMAWIQAIIEWIVITYIIIMVLRDFIRYYLAS